MQEAFAASVHGTSLASGSAFAPTCTNCHGVHGIQAASGEAASTSVGRVVFTCAECHEDPAVTRGTDLDGNVVESYERTFHGLAYAHGVTDIATCVSCHGAHDVLPSSDPGARTHASRMETTCTGCHAQVDAAMVESVTHPSEWPGFWGAVKSLNLYFPVARTALNPLFVSGMGALVGFLSGLFGVGGGFLMTPLLIFIGIPAAVAAATDAAQITAGASSGALSHARIGNVDFKMGLTIVAGGWTGGFAGVQLVSVLRNLGNFDFYLKAVYVLVLGFIGIAMFLEGVRDSAGQGALRRAEARPLRHLLQAPPTPDPLPQVGADHLRTASHHRRLPGRRPGRVPRCRRRLHHAAGHDLRDRDPHPGGDRDGPLPDRPHLCERGPAAGHHQPHGGRAPRGHPVRGLGHRGPASG